MRRPRRPALRAPEPLHGVIPRAPVGRGGVDGDRATVSDADWDAAVGRRIAERARPMAIVSGTLVVRVATSAWASELSLLSLPILARLRARGVDLRALRYRVGEVEAPARPAALRPARSVPAPCALPAELESLLATIDDVELRAEVSAAARSNLAWQSYVEGRPSTTGGSRAARVPRSAEREIAQPARTTTGAPGGPRRTP